MQDDTVHVLSSSFRDPSGFMFRRNGVLYRQVNVEYQEHYDQLVNSGLHQRLVETGLMLSHTEVSLEKAVTKDAYRVLQPQLLDFVSYPYEWSFSQLKDAALLTLQVQKESLATGMSLKDCSAYNVQFQKGSPTFIDTLSFEVKREDQPWQGYRQFCQHFLAPLALMSYRDVRLGKLSQIYIDGIPLDLASTLLPAKTYFRFPMLSHLHLHARSQQHFANKRAVSITKTASRHTVPALVDHLHATISRLGPPATQGIWSDYYASTNYERESFEHKKNLVSRILETIQPSAKLVWDLGSNTGEFSRIAAQQGFMTIAFDLDAACVERNYLTCRAQKEERILPLLLDLTNPSPSLGWECRERDSLFQRGPVDVVLALALIHHLIVSNNVPLAKLAEFFAGMTQHLIIEFVDRQDSQFQRLLSTRTDTFSSYSQGSFEAEFQRYFVIHQMERVGTSERTLYWMERDKRCSLSVPSGIQTTTKSSTATRYRDVI